MMIVGEGIKKCLVEEWVEKFCKVSAYLPIAVSESNASDISQLKYVLEQVPNFFSAVSHNGGDYTIFYG